MQTAAAMEQGKQRKVHPPMWAAWKSMHKRCQSPKDKDYDNYGGRGITVCDRWHVFALYEADIERLLGPRPTPQHTLDRVNNDGDYEPSNVRWATRLEQLLNRRAKVPAVAPLTYDGRTQLVSAWAKEIGMDQTTLRSRIKAGWTVECTLNTPVRRRPAKPL